MSIEFDYVFGMMKRVWILSVVAAVAVVVVLLLLLTELTCKHSYSQYKFSARFLIICSCKLLFSIRWH